MLYTRKGDKGTTKTFSCDQRISKSSEIAEALGTLDEINSFIGICKVLSSSTSYKLQNKSFSGILESVQEDLFIVQAELAGAPKTIEEKKVKWLEEITDNIEKELPPIKTFFISGGTELSASLDFARTLARRAERRVVAVSESEQIKIGENTLSYLNRLSSALYALARLANKYSGIGEISPKYK